MTAAKGISMDASISCSLSELDGIFTLKEDQKKILEAFLGGKHVFTLPPVFGKSLVSLWQIAAKQKMRLGFVLLSEPEVYCLNGRVCE